MSARKTELDALAMGLMLIFSVLWGFNQVAVKVANESIPPLFQSGLRSTGASILIALWCIFRRVDLFGRDRSLWPGIAAGVLFAAEFGLIYWGLEFTTASRGIVFLNTSPFVVAAGMHWLMPAERLSWRQIGGLACAFAGVGAAFAENLSIPTGRQWIGDGMMLAAAVLWGATTVLVRTTVLARIAPEKTLLYQLAVSAICLFAAAALAGEPFVVNPSILGSASLAWQIVIVAFASYLGWFWLIKRYPATRLAAFTFLAPLFGMGFGAALLGEPVGPPLIFALAMVAAGLWLINRRPNLVPIRQVEG